MCSMLAEQREYAECEIFCAKLNKNLPSRYHYVQCRKR
jgi:hypothetical protein